MGADEVDAGGHAALRRALRQPAVAALGGPPHGRLRRAAHPDRHGRPARAADAGPTSSNCQRSPWCDANSSVSAARTASMASSSSRPRSAKGTSSASNSPSTWPVPTPRIARPPDSWSSVAHALATASGCRYGQHVHVAEQSHPLGDRRQVRERGDRVPPRGAHRLGLGGGDGDVVAHGDVVEAGGLARLGRPATSSATPAAGSHGCTKIVLWRLDRQLHAEGDHGSSSFVRRKLERVLAGRSGRHPGWPPCSPSSRRPPTASATSAAGWRPAASRPRPCCCGRTCSAWCCSPLSTVFVARRRRRRGDLVIGALGGLCGAAGVGPPLQGPVGRAR